MTKLTWLGHSSWLIENAGHRVLLDPFLIDNPSATKSPEEFMDCSHILISHGHFDHIADAASIATKSGATVIAVYEIAEWFSKNHGVENTIGMNVGGEIELPFARVKMVPALHSNSLPDGSPAGVAAGFVLIVSHKRIYFACDTAYFGDMPFYAGSADVAVLPIGDLFTMGPTDSIAAIKAIAPKTVLPTHYNTWPPIEVDVDDWFARVKSETNAEPITLSVNDTFVLGE